MLYIVCAFALCVYYILCVYYSTLYYNDDGLSVFNTPKNKTIKILDNPEAAAGNIKTHNAQKLWAKIHLKH